MLIASSPGKNNCFDCKLLGCNNEERPNITASTWPSSVQEAAYRMTTVGSVVSTAYGLAKQSQLMPLNQNLIESDTLKI
jgi:hypothetical protein